MTEVEKLIRRVLGVSLADLPALHVEAHVDPAFKWYEMVRQGGPKSLTTWVAGARERAAGRLWIVCWRVPRIGLYCCVEDAGWTLGNHAQVERCVVTMLESFLALNRDRLLGI